GRWRPKGVRGFQASMPPPFLARRPCRNGKSQSRILRNCPGSGSLASARISALRETLQARMARHRKERPERLGLEGRPLRPYSQGRKPANGKLEPGPKGDLSRHL